jgi:hypothetical protein
LLDPLQYHLSQESGQNLPSNPNLFLNDIQIAMADQPLLICMTKAAVTVNNHSSSIYPKPKNKLQLNFLSFSFVKRKRLKPSFNHPNKVRGQA